MADTPPKSTLNTSGGIAREPGDGPSHMDTERPSDAGFVWGTPQRFKEAQGDVEGGEIVGPTGDEMRARTKAQIAASEKPIPNVGVPSTPPGMTDDEQRAAMMAGAIATNADNTPGPRPSPAEKAEAKARINVPSEVKADGQVRPIDGDDAFTRGEQ